MILRSHNRYSRTHSDRLNNNWAHKGFQTLKYISKLREFTIRFINMITNNFFKVLIDFYKHFLKLASYSYLIVWVLDSQPSRCWNTFKLLEWVVNCI